MVSLHDDGVGFAEEVVLTALAANCHYGLIGISERVALLGGRFKMRRMPEGGSLFVVEITHPRVDGLPGA